MSPRREAPPSTPTPEAKPAGRRRLYTATAATTADDTLPAAGTEASPPPRPRRARTPVKAPSRSPAPPAPVAEPPAIAETAQAPAAPPEALPAQPTASAPPSAGPCAPPRSPLLRSLKARQAIRDHALLAAGAMVIPVPFVDMAAEAAIQVRMVKRLAEIHGVDFAEERAKTLVAAAIGGFSAGWAAGNLLRYASFATYFANFWPSAILSSAITYGIGRLFSQHFERGGRLDDMAPETAAAALREKARSLRAKLAHKGGAGA